MYYVNCSDGEKSEIYKTYKECEIWIRDNSSWDLRWNGENYWDAGKGNRELKIIEITHNVEY